MECCWCFLVGDNEFSFSSHHRTKHHLHISYLTTSFHSRNVTIVILSFLLWQMFLQYPYFTVNIACIYWQDPSCLRPQVWITPFSTVSFSQKDVSLRKLLPKVRYFVEDTEIFPQSLKTRISLFSILHYFHYIELLQWPSTLKDSWALDKL